MSVDQVAVPLPSLLPLPVLGAVGPIGPAGVGDGFSRVAGVQPAEVVAADASTDTVEALLLSVAHGSQEAFVALQGRMGGLVRVNVRRVLRDASRCEAVTRELFAEALEDAIDFDPNRDSAQTWLLMRAHRHAMANLHAADGTDHLPVYGIDHSQTVPRPWRQSECLDTVPGHRVRHGEREHRRPANEVATAAVSRLSSNDTSEG